MRWIASILVAAVLAGCAGANLPTAPVDPKTVSAPSSPNWALGAPKEAKTTTRPTHEVPVFATGPEELLGYLDTVATQDGRVEVVASDNAALTRTYVQRSRVFGFPDIVSVQAIDLGFGDAGQRASVLLYSRSIYGYSDLGVNAARLDRWITGLTKRAPVVAGRGPSG